MQAKASRHLYLQNNPQECFANGASLLKVRFLFKLKKVTQTKACVTFYTPDRKRLLIKASRLGDRRAVPACAPCTYKTIHRNVLQTVQAFSRFDSF